MAKKQTFGDKLNKSGKANRTAIKLIRSMKSEKTGSVRFSEDMLHVPEGQSVENYIKEFIQSK
tara:strand:+ start:242 stop:430 length:189 start_codon:yes stop_codon:yes gene_type:complete